MCPITCAGRRWGRGKGEDVAKQPAKGRKAPAKSAKTTQSRKAADESTAPLIDTIPPEIHNKAAPEPPARPEPVPAVPENPAPETKKPDPETPSPAASPKPEPVAQGNRFVPMVFGGLVAGAIGFAIATLTNQAANTDLTDQVDRQAEAITALERRLADQPAVDLTPLETTQSEIVANLDETRSTLAADLAALSDRITALEQLPRGEGIASVPAIAAYEAELEVLRAQIDEMTNIAVTQLDTARAEAAAIEENAAAAARAAAGRAALARVQTAMESGAPLGAALADLEDALGEPAPDPLLAVQDGVPTLASLQEEFPDVARAALTTARREGVAGEETSGFGAFLRNQFEVRSVAPRDGTDSDAILSRAEAALRAGRLADALAEISSLPEVARAEMTDWLAQAEARADALAAADMLSTSLNDN